MNSNGKMAIDVAGIDTFYLLPYHFHIFCKYFLGKLFIIRISQILQFDCQLHSVPVLLFAWWPFFRRLLHLEIGNFGSHTLAFQSLFPWWCSEVNLWDLLATFVKFTALSCSLACSLILALLLFKKRLPLLVAILIRPVASCRRCLQTGLFWVILFP